ncbi:MAG: signal peptidase I, partial [Candidatus Lambdaproteobacteria bacterium]|nr:signal peptidase I [Candidatus Lambdaproteobacteria bacterium]
MWLHRTFHLNDGALDEMKREGLDPTLLDKLRPHRRESSFSASEFEALLAGVGRDELSRRDRQIIVRYTRLGWLRLERIVPNRTLREWIEALVFALVVAGIVRTFLFAPFKIPSGSMIPTIEIGDHIFATMYSYGIPVPFADLKLLPRPIRRGDIVIFPYPLDPSVDYIKRVVG